MATILQHIFLESLVAPRFNNGSVEVAAVSLMIKNAITIEGDHSVISNFSRILNYGKTPFGKSAQTDWLGFPAGSCTVR